MYQKMNVHKNLCSKTMV